MKGIDIARRSGQRERTASIESHPSGASQVMLPDADLLNPLLGHDIASCEEHLKIDDSHHGSAHGIRSPDYNFPWWWAENDFFGTQEIHQTYGGGDALS